MQNSHTVSRATLVKFTRLLVRVAPTNTGEYQDLPDQSRNCGARMLHAPTSEVYSDLNIYP